MKKILILGSNGMLGQEFTNYFKNNIMFSIISADQKTVDITNFNQLLKVIKKCQPDFIINCVAIIDVDYCENNPAKAWAVNATGAGNVIRALNKLNFLKTVVLHISTSDVFGNYGIKRFKENDLPLPINVYGRSKLGGEKIIAAEAKINNLKYFIIRTSWLYSEYKDTFVDFVVKSLNNKKQITIISDQYNVTTWAKDLVRACEVFIAVDKKRKSGVYHLTNQSKIKLSKYTIALRIAEILKLNKKYLKPGLKNKIFKTARPENAILVNNKYIQLPDWQDSLKKYLSVKYGKK
jgi:dTDP-4-dehydrorhamnose reductase